MYRNAFIVVLISLVYAAVRYHVFGSVEWQHFPVYVLNKAVSVSAVIFLLFTTAYCYRGLLLETQFFGRASYHCALIHIILSLAILSNAYFPKFFGDDKLNFVGEVVVLSGTLGLYGFWLVRRKTMALNTRLNLKLLATLFIAIHVFTMGYTSWAKVQQWHGYLPPISLLSFLITLACMVMIIASYQAKKDCS